MSGVQLTTANEEMREAAWEMYAQKALAEVEAVKDNRSTWISLEDFWND